MRIIGTVLEGKTYMMNLNIWDCFRRTNIQDEAEIYGTVLEGKTYMMNLNIWDCFGRKN